MEETVEKYGNESKKSKRMKKRRMEEGENGIEKKGGIRK